MAKIGGLITVFFIRRFFGGLLTIFLVSSAVFFIVGVLHGDPARYLAGEFASEEFVENLRKELGISKPLIERYKDFIKNLLKFDLGESFYYRKEVLSVIIERFKNTLFLALSSILFSTAFGIFLGFVSALKKDSIIDKLILSLSTLIYSIPNFWLGVILILIFSVKLKMLPVSGFSDLKSIVLPTLTLGFSLSSVLSRFVRNSVISSLESDYIMFAKSKGAPLHIILLVHVTKNIIGTIFTVISLQLGVLLSGTVVTETIFAFPGVGNLTVFAVNSRDFPMIQGCVIFISAVWVMSNILSDFLILISNPRSR